MYATWIRSNYHLVFVSCMKGHLFIKAQSQQFSSSPRKTKMAIILALLILLPLQQTSSNLVKTEVFVSPEMALGAGSVANKLYYGVGFPGGNIAVRSVNAELIDGGGNPVPLHEAYLHHWFLQPYYAPKNRSHGDGIFRRSDYNMIRNSGICDAAATQYFGLGAETRRTATDIPHPYGIHVGDSVAIPVGYKEGWMLNVHAIDTRGVEDKMGCVECWCDLYGVRGDEEREGLPLDYKGGGLCCGDGRRCKVREGFFVEKRSLHLRYTIKYVDWDSSSMVPLKIYILDVTDVWTKGDESKGIKPTHNCKVEYDIEACDVGEDKNGCIDSRILSVSLPSGGDVIYGVGHQHIGATGTTLYGEGRRKICSSNPIYGEENEAGNERGYLVGMSTCYPSLARPVKISAGEILTLVSNYSSVGRHVGVISQFYLLIADSSPTPSVHSKITSVPNFVWPVLLLGIVLLFVATLALKGKSGREEGYEAML